MVETYWGRGAHASSDPRSDCPVLTIENLKNEVIMAGDFNMNLLDLQQNQKAQNVANIMFGHSMISIINTANALLRKLQQHQL